MGIYNDLYFEGLCPHCGFGGTIRAEFKVGRLNFDAYHLGDEIIWHGPGESIRLFDRPVTGYLATYAYAICPKCDETSWVWVTVENNRIMSVEPSPGPDPFNETG